jgi:hypothetical protein
MWSRRFSGTEQSLIWFKEPTSYCPRSNVTPLLLAYHLFVAVCRTTEALVCICDSALGVYISANVMASAPRGALVACVRFTGVQRVICACKDIARQCPRDMRLFFPFPSSNAL